MKKFLKKILTNTGPKPLSNNKIFKKNSKIIAKNFAINSFGKKNSNKIFYIINRSPGAGLFSNVTFVLNQLSICKIFKFIPIIDMENFPTIYNEKNKINKTFNSWFYYFEPLNKFSLKEVYKSRNVIFSSPFIQKNMVLDMTNKKLSKLFSKIKIKNNIKIKYKQFLKKKFSSNQKILGVHFRGSTYKVAKGHAFPLSIEIMLEEVDNLLKKFNYKKIFLVTEELNYLKAFQKKYGDKCIYFNSFRMNKLDLFKIYPRHNHRFKMGEETVIDTLLLSECDGLAYVKSNVISAAMLFSKKKQNYHEFFLGYNSRNRYIARWMWYIKNNLPVFLGGLKITK